MSVEQRHRPLQLGVLWYLLDLGPWHTYTFSALFCVRSGAQAEMEQAATINANAVLITALIVVDTPSIIFRQCHLRLETLIAIVRADKRIIRYQSIVQFSPALVITQNLFESEIRQSK